MLMNNFKISANYHWLLHAITRNFYFCREIKKDLKTPLQRLSLHIKLNAAGALNYLLNLYEIQYEQVEHTIQKRKTKIEISFHV